jgi:hypothetical protein
MSLLAVYAAGMRLFRLLNQQRTKIWNTAKHIFKRGALNVAPVIFGLTNPVKD